MKVLIISGFLGAGKTSFIKELAKRTKKDFVILENEYGEVGIDGPLLNQESQLNQKNNEENIEMKVWELTEGCVCCSMKADFATSILTIANALDPEFLVIEPTGVGVLSRVIENVKQIEYERISMLKPITLVDGHSYDRYIAEFADIYCDQIASAGTVIVSKMEFASQEELFALEKQLKEHNTEGEILLEHYTKKEDEWWHKLLKQSLDGTILVTQEIEEPTLENIGLQNISLLSENHLIAFLEDILRGKYGNIVRAKGYLNINNAWLRFDIADRLYAITGIEEMEDTRAVFIGKDIQRTTLKQLFQ